MEDAESYGTEYSMSRTRLLLDDLETPLGCCCFSNKWVEFVKGKVVSLLEEGYDLHSIAKSFHVFIHDLLLKKPVVGSAKTCSFHVTQQLPKGQSPKLLCPPKSKQSYSEVDVWYACYGSNMWLPRFECYVYGGQVEGEDKYFEGSVDKSPIKEISWNAFPRRLFFAEELHTAWGNGGLALLHLQDNASEQSHLCLYRISFQQFRDILLQENIKPVSGSEFEFEPTWRESLEKKGFLEVFPNSLYGDVGYLGEKDGLPIVTITCSWTVLEQYISGQRLRSPPPPNYRDVIIKGLVAGKQLTYDEAVLYVDDAIKRAM